MIRYKKRITVQTTRQGNWYIESDTGDRYETQIYSSALGNRSRHMITDWWNQQYQNDLREWQKDICIGMVANALNEHKPELFSVYKKGQGFTQNHDICLIHYRLNQCWILCTQNDFWMVKDDTGLITFNVADSFGSLLNEQTRKELYQLFDHIEAAKREKEPA